MSEQSGCGDSISLTVTLNEQLEMFPAASSTIYPTFVVPTGKKSPGPSGVTSVTVTSSQLSVPVGAVKSTSAPHNPASLSTTISAGQVICGNMVSLTVIVKEQVATLPLASVTSYTSVVVPTGKNIPVPRPSINSVEKPGQLSIPTGGI